MRSFALAVTMAMMSLVNADNLVKLADMPVREVTVFKDGHAFVMHRGTVVPDADGQVIVDYLPMPILGAYWPFSADEKRPLQSVRSGLHEGSVSHPARDLLQLLQANIGAKVLIVEQNNERYTATILSVPLRGEERPAATAPEDPANPWLPLGLVMLETGAGTRVLPVSLIRDITFLSPPATDLTRRQDRHMLTMTLGGKGAAPAEVGMAYVQRGIRWIPNYRIDLDDNGHARVKLQATLINEMLDLEKVTLNLVVGVPTFAFADQPDPISFQRTMVTLSRHFQPQAQTHNFMTNSIMSQVSMPQIDTTVHTPTAPVLDLGPHIESTATDDLFVFTLTDISLRKGERLVLPVLEFEIPYEDLYTIDIAFQPPTQLIQGWSRDNVARVSRQPLVMHKVRLTNSSDYPLTTAPVLLLRNGRLLAQGMMRYTPRGAKGDLTLTTAVNVPVKLASEATAFTDGALKINGHLFTRTDMKGMIVLTNRTAEPIRIEVSRAIFGDPDSASHDGSIRRLADWQDADSLLADEAYWWYHSHWNWWWSRANIIGRMDWSLDLDAGEAVQLDYTWHYFWLR